MDIVELNYYHENPQYRRMYLQTYVVDPTNTALKAARNLKWEAKTDVEWGGNRLTLTYFVGFRDSSSALLCPYRWVLDRANLWLETYFASLFRSKGSQLWGVGTC